MHCLSKLRILVVLVLRNCLNKNVNVYYITVISRIDIEACDFGKLRFVRTRDCLINGMRCLQWNAQQTQGVLVQHFLYDTTVTEIQDNHYLLREIIQQERGLRYNIYNTNIGYGGFWGGNVEWCHVKHQVPLNCKYSHFHHTSKHKFMKNYNSNETFTLRLLCSLDHISMPYLHYSNLCQFISYRTYQSCKCSSFLLRYSHRNGSKLA